MQIMDVPPEAIQLVDAIDNGDWSKVKSLYCQKPYLFVTKMSNVPNRNVGSVISPIHRFIEYQKETPTTMAYLHMICEALVKNGANLNTEPCVGLVCAPSAAVRFRKLRFGQIFLEYGACAKIVATQGASKPRLDFQLSVDLIQCEIKLKWKRCAKSALVVLAIFHLCRRYTGTNQKRCKSDTCKQTLFSLVGKDMTRLISKEIWENRRHPKWE